ncbi:MAG: glycosyltransferase family 9 protein [Negativicutes bacterium]|nr:glycosyltransferase family 9 protein [Negativicutes bacterium]
MGNTVLAGWEDMPEKPGILLVALFNLGDVVIFSSAIGLLKEICPQAAITVMVRNIAVDAVRGLPEVDDVVAVDYHSRSLQLAYNLALVANLRRRRFDVAISFDGKLRSALLLALAGIRHRVAVNGIFGEMSQTVRRLYHKIVSLGYPAEARPQRENFQNAILRLCQCSRAYRPMQFPGPDKGDGESAESMLTDLKEQELVLMCVKGTFPLKTWPAANFAGVMDWLAAGGYGVIVVGAGEDRHYADQVIGLTRPPTRDKVVNLCGKTTLGQLAALVGKCHLMISVDTGSVHVCAAASDIPQIVIYGCTQPRRWLPDKPDSYPVCAWADCSPCSKRAEECDAAACLGEIKTGDVISLARHLMTKGRE